jgi:DNA-binding winged helix-turn-helix (wHTH) protein
MTDDSSANALRFEILGPVRAYRGAEPVDLGPLPQQAVLAVLLLHAGRPVPVQQIVAALWNGDPPENGIDVVQRYVGALRRALDPERTSLLALTPGGYLLRAEQNAVDADVFRAALARAHTEHRTGNLDAATGEVRRALALWHSEPLAGLTGPVFDATRARLHAERATASGLLAAPAHAEPASACPPPADPDHADPAGAARPAHADPAHPAHADPAHAHPAQAGPGPAQAHYAEPVDPWAGHELFPPDPLSWG